MCQLKGDLFFYKIIVKWIFADWNPRNGGERLYDSCLLYTSLETDEGICGWGEPIVEGRAATVKAAVEELSYYFLGKDPRKIEDLWQTFFRAGFYRGGPEHMSAISGIDQALWDIKGKYYNCLLYTSSARSPL